MPDGFPDNNWAPDYYGRLLAEYAQSSSSPPHLVNELETLDEGKLWSCIWEAMLFRHFRDAGLQLQSTTKPAGQEGPDLCFVHNGQKFWVEAVVPAPVGIPDEWLAPISRGEVRVRTKPDAERVLRCTSAIFDKQRKFHEYIQKRIVSTNDCLIVAVNICRLSEWDVDGLGISQLPLIAEAVFPIGPIGVPLTREGKLAAPPQRMIRSSLKKTNGAEVPTTGFLSDDLKHISAVIQWHRKDMERGLALSVVHNPFAANALPIGLLGSDKELVATRSDETWILRDVLDKHEPDNASQ